MLDPSNIQIPFTEAVINEMKHLRSLVTSEAERFNAHPYTDKQSLSKSELEGIAARIHHLQASVEAYAKHIESMQTEGQRLED